MPGTSFREGTVFLGAEAAPGLQQMKSAGSYCSRAFKRSNDALSVPPAASGRCDAPSCQFRRHPPRWHAAVFQFRPTSAQADGLSDTGDGGPVRIVRNALLAAFIASLIVATTWRDTAIGPYVR
jgi:hypothetical protein